MIGQFFSYLADTVRRPRAELTRRQQQLRYALDLVAHCWRVLQQHRAEGMAAELTYRTIFSLIPLVVLGLVTFRIFGGLNEIENRAAEQLYSFFGVPDVPEVAYGGVGDPLVDLSDEVPKDPLPIKEVEEPIEAADDDPVAAEEEAANGGVGETLENDEPLQTEQQRQQVQASIRWALRELTEKVAKIDFASIGVFGLLLFIYAAIALADSVEGVFNLIYEAPAGRPIHLRVAIHWSIITLGSGLLAMSLYMSGQLVDYVTRTTGWSVTAYANHALAIVSSWILLFLLYALMPNTRVSVRAAAVGSFVAAALWEIAKLGFQFYVSTAVPYSALYGSLGLIPLFLFWVYVTWFIILFGLVWTYTLQVAPGRVPTKDEDEQADELLPGDPQWLLPLIMEIAVAFEQGEALSREELRSKVGLPARVMQPLLECLEKAGLVRRLESEKGDRFVLSRPAEKIRLVEVLDCGAYHPPRNESVAWRKLQELRGLQAGRLGEYALSDLLRARPLERAALQRASGG